MPIVVNGFAPVRPSLPSPAGTVCIARVVDGQLIDLFGHTVSSSDPQISSVSGNVPSPLGGSSIDTRYLWFKINPISSEFKFPGQFTIDGWVYMDTSVYYNSVVTLGSPADGILVRQHISGGGESYYVNGRGGTTSRVPTLRKWSHFAVTRDVNNTARLYWDGMIHLAINVSGEVNAHNGALYIGVSSHSYSERNIGYMDEIRIVKDYCAYSTPTFIPPTARWTV